MRPRVFAAENVSVEKEKITTIHAISGNQTRLLVFFDGYNDILLERDESLPAAFPDINPVFLFDALVVLFTMALVGLPEGKQYRIAVHPDSGFLRGHGVPEFRRQGINSGSCRALLGEVE